MTEYHQSWRKSSYSADAGSNCVEVAVLPGRVAVRDSKSPDSGRLDLTPSAWRTFLAAVSG